MKTAHLFLMEEAMPDYAAREQKPPLTPTGSILRIRGLTKSYGSLQAVAGMDLDLAPGTITGLIGPNGAGKSTLMKAIAGTLRPNARSRQAQPPSN